MTLKFLGETEVPPAAIEQAVRGAVTGIPAFHLVAKGVGAFPSAGRSRVLWAGVTEGGAELTTLAERVDQACQSVGFPPETRPFTPHLTLARLRRDVSRASAAPVVGEAELFGEMDVRAVTLYQSELLRGGARHTVLATIPLSAT